ncbi:MAG: glycoside hydrolase family 92 protein [Flavobacteriales bacterium]|nr:glycoside hydrolase family 92 protein [Flavobacteriales bacterium]
MKHLLYILLLSLSVVCSAQTGNLTRFVNPFIGTGGHGHTYPGAALPFGMVQLSPDTRNDGSWDGCSGYHYNDSLILGFSHTHLSGTGCSDYGDVLIMPYKGTGKFNSKEVGSKFSHSTEKAYPGFYSVTLNDPNIEVSLTSTLRCGMHKYTFNKKGEYSILLDLDHRDKLLSDTIILLNNTTIEGYRTSEAWAKSQKVFFRIEFSKPFVKFEFPENNKSGSKVSFAFKIEKASSVYAKVSLSAVDLKGAELNMQNELPGWDFDQVVKNAEQEWDKTLRCIEVEGGTQNEKVIFYTSLYHCFLQPNLFNDHDGRYLGRDLKIHHANGHSYYTVFSLWDTYRATHPLYNLIQNERNSDFIKTFLLQFQHSGRLPTWELWSNETDCMIGAHSVSVMADAIVKNPGKYDLSAFREAAINNLQYQKAGYIPFRKNHYLSSDDNMESVSKTLEYGYDDWCIAQILGSDTTFKDSELINEYKINSYAWMNLFNPELNFIQPRANGNFIKSFDPREVNNHYTEGNGWQYGFYVPHNMKSFVNAMGGALAFEKKLDELFSADTKTTGRTQADVTGLIGQYAHGNEPSHHIAYLYNYINKPEKCARMITRIMNEQYSNAPDGLCGNEDCGQMSAWYIFSALGFYPVCPGKNEYIKGRKSLFTNVKINGVPLDSLKLNLKIYSYDKDTSAFYSAPVIVSEGMSFSEKTKVRMNSSGNIHTVYYQFKDSSDSKIYIYREPFFINESCKIRAFSNFEISGKKFELSTEAQFIKKPNNWTVNLNSKYNKQYHAGGDNGLIDGIRGDIEWRKGQWQGYQGQDFEAIVDLKSGKDLIQIGASFLQDTRSWILMPVEVRFETSLDGKNFEPYGKVINDIPDTSMQIQLREFNSAPLKKKARYVKVTAINYGKLPEWHPGAREDAFLFIDEILIH